MTPVRLLGIRSLMVSLVSLGAVFAAPPAWAQQVAEGIVGPNTNIANGGATCALEVVTAAGVTYTLTCSPGTPVYRAGDLSQGVGTIQKGERVRVEFAPEAPGAVTGIVSSIRMVSALDSGIWRNDLAFGVEFSQERDSFSKQDAALGFFSDTLVHQGGKSRVHTFFNLSFLAAPNEEAEKKEGDEDFTTFIASRKTVRGALGLYWVRTIHPSDSDVINYGPILKVGGQMLAGLDEPAGEEGSGTSPLGRGDSFKSFYSVGLRFAHHARTDARVNPVVHRYVEIAYGWHENFLDPDKLEALAKAAGGVDMLTPAQLEEIEGQGRLTVDAMLRVPGSLPFHVGVMANLGKGRDDLRLFAALKLDLDKLVKIAS